MFRIEKVKENNKQRVINFLQLDVIRHVFAFYDIQHEPDYTTMYAAFENGSLKGYVLVYTALEFPSVVLECDSDIAEKLIDYAPENRFIMHVPPNLLPIVKRKFPRAKCYVENWVLANRDNVVFFRSNLVRKLHTKDDASKLAVLLSSRKDRTTGAVKKYVELISKQPIYGVFVNDELVSYAGSFIQLPQVFMNCGKSAAYYFSLYMTY
jgi:hypothetical protein